MDYLDRSSGRHKGKERAYLGTASLYRAPGSKDNNIDANNISIKKPALSLKAGSVFIVYLFLGIDKALGVIAIPPSEVQRNSRGSILPDA